MSRLAVILLLALLVVAQPADAQPTNPFTGRAAPEAAPAPVPEPGLMARVNREIARFQRETTREMSARLRAIRDGETPFALLFGIGLAFLYGVIHAAGPGHGKAVVVGYFLAREARPWRGFLMGAQISAGHVISAIVVALVADLAFRTVWGTSATDLRGVQLASYAAIALVGLYMLVQTARGKSHHNHDHDHDHGHGHSHGGDAHAHRPQSLLSLGVGLVPCTGAILIMLFALANGILLAGIVLVAAIAAGMTVTMAALGLVAIVARRLVAGWLAGDSTSVSMAARLGEYAGGTLIFLIGVLLFWSAY